MGGAETRPYVVKMWMGEKHAPELRRDYPFMAPAVRPRM
jgi:hypothetical protein